MTTFFGLKLPYFFEDFFGGGFLERNLPMSDDEKEACNFLYLVMKQGDMLWLSRMLYGVVKAVGPAPFL